MLLEIKENKIYNRKDFDMRILKKKKLGNLETYLIFLSCIYLGLIGYKTLLSIFFS